VVHDRSVQPLSAVCPVRIGRAEEVERVRLNCTIRRPTFVTGPAGIGKSRLVAEALTAAGEAGMTIAIGHCSPEQSTPFEAFVGAIRRRIRTLDDDSIGQLFAGSATLAAAIVPEVARLFELPTDSPSQSDLFAAIWQLLHRFGAGAGAALVLEDLHWADADTLRLLEYLIQESEDLGLWILGTFRSDEVHRRHPLAPVLAQLARDRRYDEIALEPLGGREVGEMVSAILDGTGADPTFVDALVDRTGGNPFFVEEVIKFLMVNGELSVEQGWSTDRLSGAEMPASVRDTLLTRVRDLDPSALEVLHLASIDGDELDVDVLAEATGLGGPAVDKVIVDGLSLQLLVERRDGHESRYAFRHALSREALSDEMIGPERRRGHLRLAASIEEVHGEHLGELSGRLADHYVAGGDRERAVHWARRAAQSAAAAFAIDDAGRRYDQVLALMATDDPDRLTVLMEAVTALTDFTGTADHTDGRLAIGFASEARRLAAELAVPSAEAMALDALANFAARAGDTMRSVVLLREAVGVIRGHDDVLESWLMTRLCGDLTRTDQMDEAATVLKDAMGLAERAGNHQALSRLHVISMMSGPFGPESAAELELAQREARLSGSARIEHSLNQTAGYVTLWCGEFEHSVRCFERALEIGQGLSPHDGYTSAGFAWLLSLLGRYDDMGHYVERVRMDGAVPSRVVALTGRYEAAERRGDGTAGEVLDELLSASSLVVESQRSVPASSAEARFWLLTRGTDAAAGKFWDVLERTVSARGRGSHWLFSPDFAAALCRDDRVDELRRWARAISEVTANDDHAHNRAANWSVAGALGLATGELDDAAESIGLSLGAYEDMGCLARAAECELALGELALRRGDDQAGQDAAARARSRAAAFGAGAIVARAEELAQRASVESRVLTIMFTDIVSSTEQVGAMGDSAWRHLLERHNAVVRRELTRFSGREVNTTGDGFVAAFDIPTQAVRCALAVRDAMRDAGVPVRTGLHTGECQMVGDDLRGLAVHVAARVCSAAGAGEVVATSTVRELAMGLNVEALDLGERELRGAPGRWRLYALAGA
jgi:class 3 adenylate cyclase